MPYRVRGNKLQVKVRGRWVTRKIHKSHAKAVAHMKALYANVRHT